MLFTNNTRNMIVCGNVGRRLRETNLTANLNLTFRPVMQRHFAAGPLCSDSDTHLKEVIRSNTEVTRNHQLTPEIQLRLVTERCSLWRSDPSTVPFPSDPFWAFYWPGGQALTRFILDNPKIVQGRRVLDIGSGCGSCAIAAKMVGAVRVLANDIDKVAKVAIEMNARLNNIALEISTDNLIGKNCDEWDIIFFGDMFYDEEFANTLFHWIEDIARNETTIFIGDPGRHGLTEERRKALKQAACYTLPEGVKKENWGFQQATVWQYVSSL